MTTAFPFAPDRWYSAQQVQETLSLSRSTASARASAPASPKRRAPSGRSAGSGQNP